MADTQEKWCNVCCTRHDAGPRCPGELLATGPERFGWRVMVTNPTGRTEELAVLVAPSDEHWRGRILTLPNMLWCVPQQRSTMKFVGNSAQEVEGLARRYIETFCARRGLKCSRPSAAPKTGGFQAESGAGKSVVGGKDERHLHSIAVRFGLEHADRDGTTGNLSKGGLFVVTDRPLNKGAKVRLTLIMEEASLPLRGVVAWARSKADKGRDPGMGVQLIAPPALYQHYVARLAAARGEAPAASDDAAKPTAMPA